MRSKYRVFQHERAWRWAYGVLVADLSSNFYRTGRCQSDNSMVVNALRTNAYSAASNDHDVFRGLKALLPLRHELTNVGVAVWVVDRTTPLGSNRQNKDCRTGKQLGNCDHSMTVINVLR